MFELVKRLFLWVGSFVLVMVILLGLGIVHYLVSYSNSITFLLFLFLTFWCKKFPRLFPSARTLHTKNAYPYFGCGLEGGNEKNLSSAFPTTKC